ncbi:MAG: sodium:proton antiporter, partial [Planctomycetes bacterium]|nr:sodium:proton antiporter [Planctomycetota bacterium]
TSPPHSAHEGSHDHADHAATSHDAHGSDHGTESHDDHAGGHHGVEGSTLPLFWAIPFAGILLSIALFPLVMEHFWHQNYGKVALFWAVLFAVPFYYSFGSDAIYEFVHIIMLDYVPFIILLATLFTAAGGICLKGSLRGSPIVNTAILALGASLASVMGTTGAAMLLIRPLIRANKWRTKKVHLVVFFIFLVANIGGSLTPLGDPPLFLGFLKGVDFFWTMNLLSPMLITCAILLVVFYVFDTALYKKEGTPPDDGVKEPLRLEGKVNFIFLACIIGSILLSSYMSDKEGFLDQALFDSFNTKIEAAKEVQVAAGEKLTNFVNANEGNLANVEAEYIEKRVAHQDAIAFTNQLRGKQTHDATLGIHFLGVTVPYTNVLRDSLMVLIMILSLLFTKSSTRKDNFFTWEPILEVAKLFAGIFLTIIPVLLILKAGVHGQLADVIWAVLSPDNSAKNGMFFWLTGVLSSFLDNAPTYVVFFNTAGGDAQSLMQGHTTLLAISMGAVFMGANTYIGNAPNFMVKSIAEENDIKMPSFFGYMVWSVLILVPIFILMTFIYF